MPKVERWKAIADEGFVQLIGPVLSLEGSTDRYRFIASSKHKNRNGCVHGGMLMSFADRTMALTALQAEALDAVSTVQFDMQFIQIVHIGETVDIFCSIARRTRHLLFLESRIMVGQDLVATARGIWKIANTRSSEKVEGLE